MVIKTICNSKKNLFFFFFVSLLAVLYLISFDANKTYARDTDKTEAESLFRESATQFENRETDRAIETIKKSIQADPEYAAAYDRLGSMLLHKGMFDEAINAFNSALSINSRLRTSKTGIGFALMEKGDLKGAEAAFSDALLLNPYPSKTHYGLGLVYEELKDYGKAITHFKMGIEKYRVRKK